MVELLESMTLSTTLIVIGIIWLCAWICWEIVHAPLVDEDNKIIENLRKMNRKDIMDQRDEEEKN